jgi:ABC-type lipoprotein export system ATPase subunit/bifunctional DNA-binding transcriptional regulator/antitoxin component of YhaV-PrlF toxin-antitoxin module
LCDNVVKIYKYAGLEVVALQGLDLTVARGELLGIVGASGSGKSTLLNVVGGIDLPSAGRVTVDGADLLKLSGPALNRFRRERVGFVWQQSARNLIPYLTALQNVELPMILAGRGGRARRRRAEDLLDAVGLAARRDHRPPDLSGGEQQRVGIAVGLANNPALLLADEPTGEVDSDTAATIFAALQELNRRYGLTILIVSHDLGLARHVHRVVAIRDGRTSSETVRLRSGDGPAEEASVPGAGAPTEEVYEEWVVVDSAGRLQLPKEYLERYGIQGRARVLKGDNGIVIQPAPQFAPAPAHAAPREAEPRRRRWPAWLRRLRRKGDVEHEGQA